MSPEGLKLQDQSLVGLADHGFHHRPLAVLHLVEGDGNFFQVAILVVGNIAAGCAIAFQTGQLGQVVSGFGRTGFFHGGDHVPGAVIGRKVRKYEAQP